MVNKTRNITMGAGLYPALIISKCMTHNAIREVEPVVEGLSLSISRIDWTGSD